MKIQLNRQLANTVFLLVLLAFTVLIQGCMSQANGSVDKIATKKTLAIPVEAATVAQSDVAAFYSGTATLEADEQATVVSQITGVVLDIKAEEGDYVEAGQILVRVETDRYALQVERANAALKRLEMDFQRKKELYVKKLVSAEDFERSPQNMQHRRPESTSPGSILNTPIFAHPSPVLSLNAWFVPGTWWNCTSRYTALPAMIPCWPCCMFRNVN